MKKTILILLFACLLPRYTHASKGAAKNPDGIFTFTSRIQRANINARAPVLGREIFRQALILAAQSKGYVVHDAVLREPLAPSIQMVITEFEYGKGDNLIFTASYNNKEFIKLARQVIEHKSEDEIVLARIFPYPLLLKLAEELSRDNWPEKIKKTLGKPAASEIKRGSVANIDPELYAEMNSFEIIDLYIAVRKLHELILKEGENAVYLTSLARAYADLGEVCGHFHSSLPEVFAARSLIYAQRAFVLYPKNPETYYTRAYCYALAGIKGEALEQIKHVAKEYKDAPKPPRWMKIVMADVLGNQSLLESLGDKVMDPRRIYFDFMLKKRQGTNLSVLKSGAEATAKLPEAYRIHDIMAGVSDEYNGHTIIIKAIEAFSLHTLKRLKKLPFISEKARRHISMDPRTIPEEATLRGMFIEQLVKDGKKEHSAASQSVLAAILSDISYKQYLNLASHTVYREHRNPATLVDDVEPILATHPLADLIRSFPASFASDEKKENQTLGRLKIVDPSFRMYKHIFRAETPKKRTATTRKKYNLFRETLYHSSNTADELERRISLSGDSREIMALASDLWALDRYNTLIYSVFIVHDFKENQRRIDMWAEQLYYPISYLKTAASLYRNIKDPITATVYIKKIIDRVPFDYEAYDRLADILEEADDRKSAEKLLIKFLGLPTTPIERAKARVRLAADCLYNDDLAGARKYLEPAAKAGYKEALNMLADLNLREKKIDAAQKALLKNTVPGDTSSVILLSFYLEHGFKKEAAELSAKLRQFFEIYPDSIMFSSSRALFTLIEKPEKYKGKYESYMHRAWKSALDPMVGLRLYVVSLKGERRKEANQILDKIANPRNMPLNSKFVYLAKLMEKYSKSEIPEDLAKIEGKLKGFSPRELTDARYFLGWFLKTNGKKKMGETLLEKCRKGTIYSENRIIALYETK